jgi:hypothetical protein
MKTDRTPQFYFANLGIEVAGMYECRKNGNVSLLKEGHNRASGILDHIISCDNSSARTEGKVLSQIIDDIASDHPEFSVSEEDLQDYFMPFMRKATGQA